MPQEVEIKFRIDDVAALPGRLHACGFQLKTPRTHEMNVLYDLPGQPLRQKGEILRIREYGGNWTITYKSKGTEGRHKSRREIETHMADGKAMTEIIEALGLSASFRYDKFPRESKQNLVREDWGRDSLFPRPLPIESQVTAS